MPETARIGLFGGSFDPVHRGHLLLAERAQKELALRAVIFIPARVPPHKRKKELASAYHRLKMLSLALRPFPRFRISRFEFGRKRTTFTYQTVTHFRKRYSRAALFFIMGSDSLADFATWRRTERIASQCEFVVGKRGDAPPGRYLPEGRVHVLARPLPPISSSLIRERLRSGGSVRGLIPAPVDRYVRRHGLYAGRPGKRRR